MPEIETKHLFAFIADDGDQKAIDEENSTIDFVISSSVIDRDDEIVETDAIQAACSKGNFVANPVCLACHMHKLSDGMPPVIGSWQTDSFRTVGKKSQMPLQFAVDTILGGEYWKLYKAKHMRAVSIGFRTLDSREEFQGGKRIRVITKIELYEISCVPVPANPQALAKYKSGFDDAAELAVINKITGPSDDTKELEERIAPRFTEINLKFDELNDKFDDLLSIITQSESYASELLSLGEPDDDRSDSADDDEETAKQAELDAALTLLQNAVKSN